MDLLNLSPIILNDGNSDEKRKEILEYFLKSYEIDEKLYETLIDDETFYLRPDSLRHPLIFYFGHTASFYINKLILAKVIKKRVNPEFESMFAIGVDEMSWDDLNDKHYNWPSVSAVKEYRQKVKEVVTDLIKNLPLDIPITWENPFWLIMMGIEHERIHLETSSVLIRQLPISKVKKHPLFNICDKKGTAPKNELMAIEGGEIPIGKYKTNKYYGWDNEYGKHHAKLKGFALSRYLVSNTEFKEFVDDDGYHTKKWWTSEGWNWKEYKKVKFPLFWIKKDNKFYLRTILELIDMPWDWPVEINYLEAKAFCNWKSYKTGKKLRLPTEDEYYLFRKRCLGDKEFFSSDIKANINLSSYASSCPVNEFRHGNFYDVIGNVWQWTETPIYPFDKFEIHPYYDDFTVPTFDGKHNLFKGGSFISTGNEATKDARYAFRRHFYQHAGFRYVQSDNPIDIAYDTYEKDKEIIPWCDAHYGDNEITGKNYSSELVKLIMKSLPTDNIKNVLEIGCKAGRATFELATFFDNVIGIDFTTRMIKIPVKMKEKGFIRYIRMEEGELESYQEKKLKDFGVDISSHTVDFYQADPSNLLSKFKDFDLIILNNILEETYLPEKLLNDIPNRLNKNGFLVLASTYDWDDNITTEENRLGGIRINGEAIYSKDNIDRILNKKFNKIGKESEIPLILRMSRHKFIYKISEVSFWRKL